MYRLVLLVLVISTLLSNIAQCQMTLSDVFVDSALTEETLPSVSIEEYRATRKTQIAQKIELLDSFVANSRAFAEQMATSDESSLRRKSRWQGKAFLAKELADRCRAKYNAIFLAGIASAPTLAESLAGQWTLRTVDRINENLDLADHTITVGQHMLVFTSVTPTVTGYWQDEGGRCPLQNTALSAINDHTLRLGFTIQSPDGQNRLTFSFIMVALGDTAFEGFYVDDTGSKCSFDLIKITEAAVPNGLE